MLVAKAEYNYYPEHIKKKQPKVIHRKKKVKKIDKTMYLSMAIILFITSLFILSGYAKITEVRLEITKLEREVAELQKIKVNLEGDLEGLKSTTRISEDAINNLGMIYPEEDQVVYVSVDGSEVEVASSSLTERIMGVFK